MKKENYYFGKKLGRVDLNDYHTRFNLKVEEDLDPESNIIKSLLTIQVSKKEMNIRTAAPILLWMSWILWIGSSFLDFYLRINFLL
ncbi:MAG: hypothetical protein S4CHLAM7_04630 [Chlamydiae bacterium]|nr:hypothetical protein [Chlamydiota bacterium]